MFSLLLYILFLFISFHFLVCHSFIFIKCNFSNSGSGNCFFPLLKKQKNCRVEIRHVSWLCHKMSLSIIHAASAALLFYVLPVSEIIIADKLVTFLLTINWDGLATWQNRLIFSHSFPPIQREAQMLLDLQSFTLQNSSSRLLNIQAFNRYLLMASIYGIL